MRTLFAKKKEYLLSDKSLFYAACVATDVDTSGQEGLHLTSIERIVGGRTVGGRLQVCDSGGYTLRLDVIDFSYGHVGIHHEDVADVLAFDQLDALDDVCGLAFDLHLDVVGCKLFVQLHLIR